MPRTKTGKGAGGAGSIRKITTTRNGKTYTYWQGRYTEGFDPGTGKQIQRSITGKTQKEVAQKLRQITAAPFVVDLLKKQRRLQESQKRLAGEAWENSGLVFTNEMGHHLSAQTVYLHFKKLAGQAGFPSARFHDLRHSYAVVSLQSGDDIKTVQENLGHHTAAFTLDVYGHVTEQMKRNSADRMQRFIESLSKE